LRRGRSTFAKKAMELQKQAVEELLNKLMATFNEGAQGVVSYFAEDAIIQFPYSGRNDAVMNRQQYFNHLSLILPMMDQFLLHSYRLYATDEQGTYWGTLDLEGKFKTTGKKLRQNYVIRFSVNINMKITQYYEYGNPLKFMEAFGWGRVLLYLFSNKIKTLFHKFLTMAKLH
jgi:ketosteroid isomerase-like protein